MLRKRHAPNSMGCLGVLLLLVASAAFAQQPTKKPTFRQKMLARINQTIFTGGLSVVFPLGAFRQNLSTTYGGTTGIELPVSTRFFVGASLGYNSHPFESDKLYPTIRLKSETDVVSLLFNGRYRLRSADRVLNGYVYAGLGGGSASRPSITTYPGSPQLEIGKQSELVWMANGGAGLDIRLSKGLILYIESSYVRTLTGSQAQFVPILIGFRTFTATMID